MLIVQKNILATSSEYWAQISKDREGVRKEKRRMNTGWRKQERTCWEAVREGCRKFDLWKPYLNSVHQDSLWGDWCPHTHRLNTFPGRSRGISMRATPSGHLHQGVSMRETPSGRLHEGDSIRLGPWAKPHLVNCWAWSPSRADLCGHFIIACNFLTIFQTNHSCLSWQTFDFLSLQKKSKICFPKTLWTALLLWFWWILSISKGSGTRNLRQKILWRKSFGWTRYCL